MEQPLNFDLGPNLPSIIKVIGVGGGGGNAVNHMFKEGIHDVTFVVCNTDHQALAKSPIPVKVQLGRKITEGLGAGGRPEVAEQAAIESMDDIERILSDNTKMVFITAGMGGGTGTGAAPVIAKIAKEKGILTVGIVTIPFAFEGRKKIIQALDGVERMSINVDALLVVNNERLRGIYPDMSLMNAFKRADDTLTVAAKSIAEIITIEGYVNCDFADVNTIMRDGGVAIMSAGYGKGENRISTALCNALNSPLLNNNDVFKAKKVLLYLSSSDKQEHMVRMEEMGDIHEFMGKFGRNVEVIWGAAFDSELSEEVKVTILATGFDVNAIPELAEAIAKREGEEKSEEELKEASENQRVEEAYGKDTAKEVLRDAQTKMILLDSDHMDNEKLIDLMEAVPTFYRDYTQQNEIKLLMREKKY